MYIDAGGGAALVDDLNDLGYDNVIAVNFGGASHDPEKYTNMRNQMWQEMSDWLTDETVPVQLPDDDEVQADLMRFPVHMGRQRPQGAEVERCHQGRVQILAGCW